MTRYVLECPECDSRFELTAYEPERRVRCRNCDAVVIIPYAPGDAPAPRPGEAKPLKPELRAKVVRALSLRKLALVAFLLATAAAGGFYILVKKREAGPAAPPAAPEERLTLQKVTLLNRTLVLPLGTGFSWEYDLAGGGTEARQVVQAGLSPSQEPEYDLAIRGSSQAVKQILRVRGDGIYVAAEIRSEGKREYAAPVLLVPYPMYSDAPWTQSGEQWKVDCVTTLLEQVECPAGKFSCFRVELKGTKGGRPVEEVHWYAKGVGLVKRKTKLENGVEEALLRKYTQQR